MRPRVYVETSVISYLVARPSRDLVVAGHQEVTREWWEGRRERFELVASQLVLDEVSAGDPEAARRRAEIVEPLVLLEIGEDTVTFADRLIGERILPPGAADDAIHVALAITHGVDYLLTWNCRHIANAVVRRDIEHAARSVGYVPTIICTPEELLHD